MESASIPRKRIAYIDVARGIGILLVVAGHNDVSLVAPYLHQWIYSFHMPLFFFLSGYFFKPAIPFGELLKKRFNTLLKPYIFTILLIYGVSVSFGKMSFETALRRLAKSAYASGYYLDWVQLWFIPHLFLLSFYALLFYALFKPGKNHWPRILALSGLYALGVYAIGTFWDYPVSLFGKEYVLFGLPFSADLLLVSGFFFVLGSEIRNLLKGDFFEKVWVTVISGTVLFASNYFFVDFIDFNGRFYPNWYLSTLEALLGITFVLSLSTQIAKHTKRLSTLLQYVGNASLFILIFHVPIQAFWGDKIQAVGGSLGLSIALGFVFGVLVSVLIYELFIRNNPTALWWFGRTTAVSSSGVEAKGEEAP
jgi:fucose 4-O-acetylase-like acetyltransferase